MKIQRPSTPRRPPTVTAARPMSPAAPSGVRTSSSASISGGTLTTEPVSSDQGVTITATYSGKSDTHFVTIQDIPATVSSILITGPTQVDEDSTAQYTATATYSDGSTANVTGSAVWSENSSSASISGGTLTTEPVSSDQGVTITATYSGQSDTHSVTIQDIPATVSSICDHRSDSRSMKIQRPSTPRRPPTVTAARPMSPAAPSGVRTLRLRRSAAGP